MNSLSGLRIVVPLTASVSLLATAPPRPLAPPPPSDRITQMATQLDPRVTLPKVAEHLYRIDGKIRLLLFWIGRDDVGTARITWYRGPGADRGYEFLIGSDPARAPRKINRWGYICEEQRSGLATTVGVMKPANEATLDEARKNVEAAGTEGVKFSMIRETVNSGESVAEVTSARVKRDYSYRDLEALLEDFARAAAKPEIKRAHLDSDVTPGLLSTIAAVMHEDAEARRKTPNSRGVNGRIARYVYNAQVYTLTLASSQFLGPREYDGRKYANLVQNEFEITMKGFTWKEHFTVVYTLDTSGPEVPVFAVYQPRWWFKVELLLDDSHVD